MHWDQKLDVDTDRNARSRNAKDLSDMEQSVYIALTEEGLEQGQVKMYMTDDVDEMFYYEASILEQPLRQLQLARLGLSEVQQEAIANQVAIVPFSADEGEVMESGEEGATLDGVNH